jgi:deoxyribodipyrimidine photo-lyase
MSKNAFFWFRRDLRWDDNAGLYHALRENESVRLVFIFDELILSALQSRQDLRVLFIHQTVIRLRSEIEKRGGLLEVYHGRPEVLWKELLSNNPGSSLYLNHDYEPKARRRDLAIEKLCGKTGCFFKSYKDQVIFEKSEILNGSRLPYTVFTPYKKKWLQMLSGFYLKPYPVKKYLSRLAALASCPPNSVPSLNELGFNFTDFEFPPAEVPIQILKNYANERDFPAMEATSKLGLHLRFGTLSIRQLVLLAKKHSAVWLSELIWREFFMQILYHFPYVEESSFRTAYDKIAWRKSIQDFQRWKEGRTGYPLVDAGMRELNQTGFMHNRVRMVTASFLTKHLLIHWLEGEKYFAEKLLDYDLSANNGNWQWVAGSGCDASPYFRVFNPDIQKSKFDKYDEYVTKWIPELNTESYPQPMVEHTFARDRALQAFQAVLKPVVSQEKSE